MQEFDREPGRRARVLWVVPLVAGLLPMAAAFTALWAFSTLGRGPVCNPFIEGCVSISRTARYGLAHYLFLVFILPAAAMQGLTWVLCRSWLNDIGAVRDGALRLLPWLGVAAALFLAVYPPLLGTPGQPYDLVRVYGIPIYFGGTYLCMVITSKKVRRAVGPAATRLSGRLQRLLILLAVFLTGAGLVQIGVRPFVDTKDARDRLTNVLEWHSCLAFSLFFLVLAGLWYHTRVSAQPAKRGQRARAAGSAGGEPAGALLGIGRRTQ
ncbi:MAG: hypothetical protein ACREM3_17715 [Candidatus Rokuibacteriota bacterium]